MISIDWHLKYMCDYNSQLIQYAYYFLRDWDQSQSLIEEVFVKFLKNRSQDNNQDSQLVWLFAACRRLCLEKIENKSFQYRLMSEEVCRLRYGVGFQLVEISHITLLSLEDVIVNIDIGLRTTREYKTNNVSDLIDSEWIIYFLTNEVQILLGKEIEKVDDSSQDVTEAFAQLEHKLRSRYRALRRAPFGLLDHERLISYILNASSSDFGWKKSKQGLVTVVLASLLFLTLSGLLLFEANLKKYKAQNILYQYALSLHSYKEDCGDYPNSLRSLVNNIENCRQWRPQRYLGVVVMDPWGEPYVYEKNDNFFVIKSIDSTLHKRNRLVDVHLIYNSQKPLFSARNR